MLSVYPACFFKEENGYSVVFPDLNSATSGETIDDAMNMAIDLLAGLVYSAKIDGEELPPASALQTIDIGSVAKDLDSSPYDRDHSFVNLVSVDAEEYAKLHFTKSVKKTLSIPLWMNDKAVAMGINFSQTLQEALLQKFV
ncbi:MAG: type II toxin-antitoxin system HicB family antitoxin [Lachnospiraceae bacterium]|nr:type II toxin-antitoxin system HicB family antitoxin [Lachnospiraceae bacterium]